MKSKPSFSHGILYFSSFQTAYDYAVEINWPTGRIFNFGKGWAIQFCESSHYAGPNDFSVDLCP